MSPVVTFAFLGAAIAGSLAVAGIFRSNRALPRWSFATGMALLTLECVFLGLSASPAANPADSGPWQEWRLVVVSFLPFVWLLFSCSYGRASGSPFLPWHRIPLVAVALLPLGHFLFSADTVVAPHPDDPPGLLRFGWAGLSLHAGVLIGSVLTVMNLERTFHASVGTVRWRMKYMLIGVGLIFVVRVYTSSQALVFRATDAGLESVNAVALLVASPLILRALHRAGRLDLDVYPSGPMLRNSLTVLAAGLYLVIVGLFAKLVSFLGGDAAFSFKAFVVLIAVVVLAVALQSDRVQLYARQFVSRHFQRPIHDNAAVWRRVTEATTSRVEQPALCASVASLTAEVFQMLAVRVWLCDEKKAALTLVASTATGAHAAGPIDAAAIVAHFESRPDTVDLDADRGVWCGRIREAHPREFATGGHRFCAPLLGRGELLGMITLGDRVGGVPMATQDLELLRCIAEHAAAGILNIRLSQQLLQAKQLEAFQSMAAFFIHDLKNAASTLNLTLKNLPLHFDDPAFRADALRGIGKTAAHINHLIARLTALRHELRLQTVETDLNEVVRQAIAAFGHLAAPQLVTDMHPVPRLPLDREQLQKVVTNLVLNATEATPAEGRVCVSTGQQNGWVVLTVDDTGCGMSGDFVAHSLFRPFQTTKKSGLGIGMFQSKMIVEAHGGRIAVTSQPGAGTRFQVFLRQPAPAR